MPPLKSKPRPASSPAVATPKPSPSMNVVRRVNEVRRLFGIPDAEVEPSKETDELIAVLIRTSEHDRQTLVNCLKRFAAYVK